MQQVYICQNKREPCTKYKSATQLTYAGVPSLHWFAICFSYYEDKHWTHNDRQWWEYIHRYISLIHGLIWQPHPDTCYRSVLCAVRQIRQHVHQTTASECVTTNVSWSNKVHVEEIDEASIWFESNFLISLQKILMLTDFLIKIYLALVNVLSCWMNTNTKPINMNTNLMYVDVHSLKTGNDYAWYMKSLMLLLTIIKVTVLMFDNAEAPPCLVETLSVWCTELKHMCSVLPMSMWYA